ncbi:MULTISPECIES: FlgO family outer membrane protein [unclassified Modicisalibacter]|uniref:FlgO family outer membrane protein n=1 Tax=unclassified Modicisalibacter TaxID=2679913 RepID=UPI001CCDD136|nr:MULTISPECIES: FlgO family outer membrane protein [unclassified Modicisalibacter]MBZ9556972.1 hypothetical protein [Modicisalibacter sp. R2A 31.J]MBZ9574314.1 hypothetical protein [Modicisalibacter sp. MOD 31.J]
MSPLRSLLLLAALSIMPLVSGCATSSDGQVVNGGDDIDVPRLVQHAVDDLLANTHGLDPSQPVVAASFVDIDDLRVSSTFGRILSETFASYLARAGLPMIEVKMRDSLFIEERRGELVLSRDIRRLSVSHDAQAILVGTYARGQSMAYVNVRLVRTRDNAILGASSLQIPLDYNTRAMFPAQW